MSSRRLRLHAEHKEVGKDLLSVLISYTPISGIVDTAKFFHKWVYKKNSFNRMARYIDKKNRKLQLKAETRKDRDRIVWQY